MKCENCGCWISEEDPVICVECLGLQSSLDKAARLRSALIDALQGLRYARGSVRLLHEMDHLDQWIERVRAALVIEKRPRIVCLCGSTRFAKEFMAAQFTETMAGRIVLTVGCFPRKPDGTWDRMMVTDEQKTALDALHLRKIEMADEVFVVNVGDYVGPSTKREIEHAKALGKSIRWWTLHDSRST